MRDALIERREAASDDGDASAVGALRVQIRDLDTEILSLIDNMIAFWSASSRPEAAATIAQLQNLRNEVVSSSRELVITGGQIQEIFADTATDRLTELVEALGS